MLSYCIKWAALENTGTIRNIKICLHKDKDTLLTFKQFFDALLKQEKGNKASTAQTWVEKKQIKKV
jgi:hypothetical protein